MTKAQSTTTPAAFHYGVIPFEYQVIAYYVIGGEWMPLTRVAYLRRMMKFAELGLEDETAYRWVDESEVDND